jgi:hypothetical protein
MERTPNNGSGDRFGFNFGGSGNGADRIAPLSIAPDFTGPDPGDSDNNGTSFDPTEHSGRRNRDGSWARKRGRRAGEGSGQGTGRKAQSKAAKFSQADIANWSGMLVMGHAALARISKTPEWSLETDDADMLATAQLRFLEAFEIRPDPKVQATITLIGACTFVYGPKIALIRMRIAEQQGKPPKKPPENNNITPFLRPAE